MEKPGPSGVSSLLHSDQYSDVPVERFQEFQGFHPLKMLCLFMRVAGPDIDIHLKLLALYYEYETNFTKLFFPTLSPMTNKERFEEIRGMMARFNVKEGGVGLEPYDITFPRLGIVFAEASCGYAKYRQNDPCASLGLTDYRRAISMQAFAAIIPEGDKYKIVRRAHYYAMYFLSEIIGSAIYKKLPDKEKRQSVKRFADITENNIYIHQDRRVSLFERMSIFEGDQVHPEVMKLAALWPDD